MKTHRIKDDPKQYLCAPSPVPSNLSLCGWVDVFFEVVESDVITCPQCCDVIRASRKVPLRALKPKGKGRGVYMEIRKEQAGALSRAIKVLAENLASRFVDPSGVDCSDYPKWGPRHTRTDRFEMRTRRWIAWALEKAKADPEIKI